MDPLQIFVGFLTLLAFTLFVPAWIHFMNVYGSGLDPVSRFLAQLALPALAVFFIASHFSSTPTGGG